MNFYIVTPSYNQLDYLKRCVASVRDQVVAEAQRSDGGCQIRVHHHVQDACSTDGSVDWLCQYEAEVRDQRTSAASCSPDYTFSYSSERDEGMYDAINKGWRQASDDVDVVAWLNCDEQYLPGTLQRVFKWFDVNPKKEILFGDALVVRPDGSLICLRRITRPQKNHIATSHLPTFSAAMFIRWSAVLDHNLFLDPHWKLLGDVDLVLKMLDLRIPFGMHHEPLAVFTDSGQNISLTDSTVEKERMEMRNRLTPSIKRLRPVWMLLHRLHKLCSGAYLRRSVDYSIFTDDSARRKDFSVARAPVVWKGRL